MQMEANKGNDAGARHKELLLMALGGCTASEVISILSKKRVLFPRIETIAREPAMA